MESLRRLEGRLGVGLGDRRYLFSLSERARREHLAWLGNAVIQMTVTRRLYAPERSLVDLQAERKQRVCGDGLAQRAMALDMPAIVAHCSSGRRAGLPALATTMEAVVGDVVLRDGIEAGLRVADRLLWDQQPIDWTGMPTIVHLGALTLDVDGLWMSDQGPPSQPPRLP